MRRFAPFALLLLACYGEVDAGTVVPPGIGTLPERFETARLWIQNHVDLEKVTLLRGANLWNEKGAQHLLVPIEEADIVVTMDERPCEPDSEFDGDLPPSAYASSDGRIVFFNRCIARAENGRFDPAWMAGIMAHEMGHHWGIDHIPFVCDGSELVHEATGVHVCGIATMNPNIKSVTPTLLDWLAFDLRQHDGVLNGTVVTVRQRLMNGSPHVLCEIRQ